MPRKTDRSSGTETIGGSTARPVAAAISLLVLAPLPLLPVVAPEAGLDAWLALTPGTRSLLPAATGGLVASALALAALAASRTRLVLDRGGIAVRRGFSRPRRIPWDAVDRFDLLLVDGRHRVIWSRTEDPAPRGEGDAARPRRRAWEALPCLRRSMAPTALRDLLEDRLARSGSPAPEDAIAMAAARPTSRGSEKSGFGHGRQVPVGRREAILPDRRARASQRADSPAG